jgi:hypothetical protein
MPMYLILDPPVNPFSSRSRIEAWIKRLDALSISPDYTTGQGRVTITAALLEARSWLNHPGAEGVQPSE